MKKLLILLVLLLLIAGGGYLFLRSAGQSNPANYLPAGTVFYAELPDMDRTLRRWKESPLALMAKDPSIAPFLQRPGSRLRSDGHFSDASEILRKLELRQIFLAVPKMPDLDAQGGAPSLVLGFRSEAGAGAERKILDRLHLELTRQAGGSEAVSESLDGIELQRQVLPQGEIWTVVAGGWGLVGTDGETVRNFVLAMRQPTAEGTLATQPDFLEARSRMGDDPDFVLYLAARPWIDALEKAGQAAGATPDPAQFALIEKIRAFAFSSTLSGKNSIERKIILGDQLPDGGNLDNSALALAPENTLLYLATRLDTSSLTPDFLQQTFGPLLGTILGENGPRWNELPSCIGQEGALFLWWPNSSLLPAVVARIELADAAKTENIMASLLGSITGESLVRDESGWRVHSLPNAGFGLLSPVLAFGSDEVLVTLNSEDLATLRSVRETGANFAGTPLYRSLALQPPMQQLGILDLAGLVRRAHLTIQPMLGFAAAMSPDVAEVVDLEKFPAVENITRHLGPVVAVQRPFSGGVVTEVRGPILMSHLLLGAAAGAREGFEGLPGKSTSAP